MVCCAKTTKENEMKKLVILAVAVVASVVTNAAAIEWGSGTITLADSTAAGKDTVTGYLFLVDATTYATYTSITDAKALSDAVYAAYGSKTASATQTGSSTKKSIVKLSDTTVYSSESTAYGIILYTEGDNYMGNYATYTFDSSMDVTIGNLAVTIGGDIGGGATATAWSTAAVPEPTSGLLLLLGMAGLALKRKRA